jgi:hypothetical protein
MEASTSGKTTKSKSSSGDKTETYEDALEAGHFGEMMDPTPRENYTVQGVGAGKPTPETDADAKAAARQHRAEAEARLSAGE